MDTKEIEKRGRDLSKAVTSGESSAVLLSLLKDLSTGVKASEEILRLTKIGITVNKLKQHKDTAVARQATDLVSKWRKDIKSGAGGASDGKASSNVNGSTSETRSKSPAFLKPNSSNDTGNPGKSSEQRNTRTDNINTQQTGNATRDNSLKLMYDGLAFMSESAPNVVLTVAIAVEAAAYTAYAPETSEQYKSKIRSLFQNLKNKSNPQLRARVLGQEITPNRFVHMTLDELKSPQRRAEEQQIHKENMDKAMVAQEEKSISTSFTCSKCHQKKVSYTQAQTRSADEPMTTFCECTVCGNRWKFS